MRIALIYPPPWKIPAPGELPDGCGDGPPDDYQAGDLDADFFQTPYGLFSLGAQALRAGHQVKVLNLSGFAWSKVEEVIGALDAELFAMSCWTSNRRGVALVAQEIKRGHPKSHVLIEAPHATPLGREILEHYQAIDTVSLGESEEQFMELVARLGQGDDPRGIAGTLYRDELGVQAAPGRGSIHDLDALASPHECPRHAHRDDLAWLPLAMHVLRCRDHVGARLSRATGELCARRARKGGRPAQRQDGPSEGRHLHHQQEARAGAVSGHSRTDAVLSLKLRYAGRCLDRRALVRDAPGGLSAAESRGRDRFTHHPEQHQ